MTGLLDSYFSPKLDVRAAPAKGGFGVFAGESISASELLIVWGGRYAGFFSPYLQRRITLLKQGLTAEAGEGLFELAEPPRLKREQP